MKEADRLFRFHRYKIVARSEVGPYVVSTVWLGLDQRHRFHPGQEDLAPLIFETMVFSRDEWNDPNRTGLQDIDCLHYSTEDEAITGHRQTVELIMATSQFDWLTADEGAPE